MDRDGGRRKARFAPLAGLLVAMVTLAPVSPSQAATTARSTGTMTATRPVTGSGTGFDLYVVYLRSATFSETFAVVTPVKDAGSQTAWKVAYTPTNAWDGNSEPYVDIDLSQVSDPGGAPKMRKNRLYRVSGTVGTETACGLMDRCVDHPVLLATRVTEVPASCTVKSVDRGRIRFTVCGTPTEILGATSDYTTGKVHSMRILVKKLQSGTGRSRLTTTVPGSIEGSLTTGSITLPAHVAGTCRATFDLRYDRRDDGRGERSTSTALRFNC